MYIAEPNLPQIPPELQTLITGREAFRNTPWLVRKNGRYHSSGHYQRCDVKPALIEWINSHVTEEYLHVSACEMYGERHNAPHTDTTRDFTLIYLTELGGGSVRTVFYQELDQDLLRPRHTHPNYDDLIVLKEYELELGKWYLLDSRIVHSVEGIEGVRKSIQVGFDRTHSWAREFFQ